MSDFATRFIDQSREYLRDEYLPKIHAALAEISHEDLWWRPNGVSNSIGNLLLHLTGNLRQLVVSGLGGAPDARRRDQEFAEEAQPDLTTLLGGLSSAVVDADTVLATLDTATLGERLTVQGKTLTGLEALYHAVEHFSMHTGQILYIAKLRTGKDLRFYEFSEGAARRRWPGVPREG
jgi:uncharacterized damage-inducible protein DinB